MKSLPSLRIPMHLCHQCPLVGKIQARLFHMSMLRNRWSLLPICSCKLHVDAVRRSRPDPLLRRGIVLRQVAGWMAVHRNGGRNPSLKATWIDISKTWRNWSWSSTRVSLTVQVDERCALMDSSYIYSSCVLSLTQVIGCSRQKPLRCTSPFAKVHRGSCANAGNNSWALHPIQ